MKTRNSKRRWLASPYIIWMAIFIIIPLAMVIYFAFTNESHSFTLQNIMDMGEYTKVFIESIKLATVSTLICLLIGYPFAKAILRLKVKNQMIVMLLLMLPLWINFLLRTYAWMTLLENTGLINRFLSLFGIGPFQMINTRGAVVLGMVYNFLPYMIIPIYNVMTKIDRHVIEAAQDLGAGSLNINIRIIFPLSVPGIVSGITMVFVPAVSTFIISTMLGGSSNMLIGDLIELQFLGGSYNPYLGSAMSLVLMVLIIISMAIMNEFDTDESEVIVA